jgi:hypothetical protein
LKDCVSEMLIFPWLQPCDSECGGVLHTWLKSAEGCVDVSGSSFLIFQSDSECGSSTQILSGD